MDIYALNETSVLAEWTGSTGDPGNGSLDPAGSTWGDRRAAAAAPPPPHHRAEDPTLRILLYALVFLMSVFGNLLIIVVLVVNKRMRTVTNTFLLSLALSDLMMAVSCMPFSLIPSILKDFIFGAAMCKIVVYLMGISVSISTFSLVAIAIERYSAICNPLKSRVWQTRSHAYRVIAATWVLAFVVMTPYPIVTHLDTHQRDNTTVHQCRHMWPHVRAEQTWCILLMLVLFLIPGVVMIVAYGLISRELYRGIQFETGQNREATGVRNGLTSSTSTGAVVATGSDDGDGCYVHVAPARPHAAPVEMSTLTAAASAPRPPKPAERPRSNTSEAKLVAKRRVIRMLVVIVVLFFICWMPLYCANTWRAFDNVAAARALAGSPISYIQLLGFTSACVNPVIYCFMNTRFRKALIATFSCCTAPCRRQRRRGRGLRDTEEDAMATGASMSKFSYTTVSTMGTC